MHVHRTLGNGFQEVIYQRALSIEFQLDNLKFERELEMDKYYRDRVLLNFGQRSLEFKRVHNNRLNLDSRD